MVLATAVGLLAACAPDPSEKVAGESRAACTLASTSGTISREVDGREYYLNVPDGLSGPAVPLLLGLHGAGQPPLLHERDTDWSRVAATRHFIVAYPSTPGSTWDFAQGSADVDYLRDVVLDISSTWCVNSRQVHAEGHSNGALMAARLACDASTVFASVAVYAGIDPASTGSPCEPERPIAVGIFHGIADPISFFPLAQKHRDNWLRRNVCPPTPTTEPGVPVEASVYGPCKAGVEVVWRVYRGGHFWPAGDDTTGRMWDFFMRNPLPTDAAK